MLSRPRSSIARIARVFTTLSLGVAVAVASSVTAFAQSVPVVRDAEIEALVRDYARPIFKAAGLANDGIDIVLVNDSSFNAFVTGRRLFINTGALMTAETPNEIIGVIAHEAGHIAGGHQQKLRDQLERAKTMAIIATLLGVLRSLAIWQAALRLGGNFLFERPDAFWIAPKKAGPVLQAAE